MGGGHAAITATPQRALVLLLGGALGPVAADVIASAAAFAAALALSAATYRLIEEPGRRTLSRATQSWTQRTAVQRR